MDISELLYKTIDGQDLWVMGSPIMDRAEERFKPDWKYVDFELRIEGKNLGFRIWFLAHIDKKGLLAANPSNWFDKT